MQGLKVRSRKIRKRKGRGALTRRLAFMYAVLRFLRLSFALSPTTFGLANNLITVWGSIPIAQVFGSKQS
jgi:hypothetical protein